MGCRGGLDTGSYTEGWRIDDTSMVCSSCMTAGSGRAGASSVSGEDIEVAEEEPDEGGAEYGELW